MTLVKQPTGEMSETMLLVVSEIFWPTGDWERQKRFYYDETNKRKFYKVANKFYFFNSMNP